MVWQDEYVDAYRLPALVRGWEGGILRFLAARVSDRRGVLAALRRAARPDHLTQLLRLAQVGTCSLTRDSADTLW